MTRKEFAIIASGIRTYYPRENILPNDQSMELWFRQLEDIGFIRDLSVVPEESVSFHFRDAQVRAWLRDVGSVLELYVYKTCLDTGLFQDVITSAAQAISEITRYTAVVMMPKQLDLKVSTLQLVPMPRGAALLVIVALTARGGRGSVVK